MRAADCAHFCAPFLTEFVGTFFVVLVCILNVETGTATWTPISIGFCVMVTMYATAGPSSGHLNPSISLSFGICGKMDWGRVVQYFAVQLAAGLAAGVVGLAFLQGSSPPAESNAATSSSSPAAAIDAVFCRAVLIDLAILCVLNVIYSTMLCLVALNTMPSARSNPHENLSEVFAMAVGFVVIAGGHTMGGTAGGFFNPAVTFGFGVVRSMDWLAALLHVLMQFIASAVASQLFFLVRPEEWGRPQPQPEGGAILPTTTAVVAVAEAPMGSVSSLTSKVLCEFIGTFVLVLTFVVNAVVDNSGRFFGQVHPDCGMATSAEELPATWAAGAAVMALVYALGDISGGHFNPAVTVAVALSGRDTIPLGEAIIFVVTQLAAGIAAASAYCFPLMAYVPVASAPKLKPRHGYGWMHVVILEGSLTSFVAVVYLCLRTVRSYTKAPNEHSFQMGLAIGMSVSAGGLALMNITGGCLNPAVSLGLAFTNLVGSGDGHGELLYCFVEALGGAFAVVAFAATHVSEYKASSPLLEPRRPHEAA
jgi:aquaporin Z